MLEPIKQTAKGILLMTGISLFPYTPPGVPTSRPPGLLVSHVRARGDRAIFACQKREALLQSTREGWLWFRPHVESGGTGRNRSPTDDSLAPALKGIAPVRQHVARRRNCPRAATCRSGAPRSQYPSCCPGPLQAGQCTFPLRNSCFEDPNSQIFPLRG